MKVLFFSHQADFIYGGEVCTLAFMKELQRKGVEVHFASPPGPYQKRASAFARCHAAPSLQFSRRLQDLPSLLWSIWKTRSCLKKIMIENKIDILHATSLKAMVFAWLLGRENPVVWHHHDILPSGKANNCWVRILASRSRLILGPSAATVKSLVEAGVEPKKCFVLHNGFSPGEWNVRPERLPSPKFRVALVGEISPRKGIDRLPGIFQALRERGGIDGFEFIVIGDGLSAPTFASEMRQILRPEPVTFLGRREDVRQLMQGIDLLLVPSRQDPLPTVIVEASFSGVPAVGARVGGIPEMIVQGESGFLADSDEEYADALFEARDIHRWQALSRSARLNAEENFDIGRLSTHLLEIYGKILERPRQGSC